MNSATMEFKKDNSEDDDALSLRDLQMYDHTATSSNRSSPSPRASSGQELFEFFPNPSVTGDIVFCGKVIHVSADEGNDEAWNDEYQNRDSLKLVGSSSFRLPERPIDHLITKRSVSNRDLGSPRHGVKFSTSVKKANVASMSSKSKRSMFMFGPVKFAPKMEMSAIRERQGRLAPSRMFPVVEGGGAGNVVTGGGTHKNQMLRCRARLNSAFERSLACLRSTLNEHLFWKLP